MAALQRIGGRYLLRERIGAGGMGEVWLARDEGPDGFQKTVVVKRMLPEAARYLDYFKAEARLVAQLPHQNIVQVTNFFIDEDGQHNIVMEYVEGSDLEELIFTERGRLTVEMAVYIAAEALKGLDFAHSARIDRTRTHLVHRDISPHNILVSYGAEVKITDFGIAQAELAYREKTEGNKFRGKIAYAAPEALTEAPEGLDRRADIYAMGVTLREMLTKERTFTGSMWQVLVAVKEGQVRPLAQAMPQLPPALCTAVDKMMCCDREQRFMTAADARAALVRAVPDWAVADGPLRDYVRAVTRRQPRLTSPFLDSDGLPVPIREEGTPIPIPTLIKASPEAETRLGHVRAEDIADASTLPAGFHAQTTQLHGSTALLDDRDGVPYAVARTASAETVGDLAKRTLGDWGRFLVGIGVAFSLSAVVVFSIKRTHHAAAPLPMPAVIALADAAVTPVADAAVLPAAVVPAPATPLMPPHPHGHHHDETIPSDLGAIVMASGNADVSVDGIFVGHTPVRYLVAPGEHRVSLIDTTTFKRASVQVKTAPGHATHVDFPANAR
jgi:serine/threonine protein kinase